jgi:hypothetical protein
VAAKVLAILEDCHRGAAETQFADVLYLLRELNRQLGGVDLVLRGSAVFCALDGSSFEPAIVVASRRLTALPVPHRSLRGLLNEGVEVLVDADDLEALGMTPERLLAGARAVGADAIARRWIDYDGVWFL